MTADGDIIVIAPTHFLTGVSNAEIGAQLRIWAAKTRNGLVCDSSTGFVLPNGAPRSPDASWTLKSRLNDLSAKEKRGYLHLCPDFVIEVRSDSDRLRGLRAKMRSIWLTERNWAG